MNEPSEKTPFEIVLETVAAPLPDISPEAALLNGLEDIGVLIPNRLAAHRVLEAYKDRAGDERLLGFLRWLFERLKGTSGGEALRVALYGNDTESLREAAARAGVSHVALWKQVQTLAARVNKLEGVSK